jgi:cellulose/xylan binding protein with CBM9 domain
MNSKDLLITNNSLMMWVGILFLALFTIGCIKQMNSTADNSNEVTACREANIINLVPTPQHIRLLDKLIPLSGMRIIVPNSSKKIQAGVDFINNRIKLKGGSPLTVDTNSNNNLNQIIIGIWDNPDIRKLAHDSGLSEDISKLGEQSYHIDTIIRNNKTTILLRGVDRCGTLYACVTLANLIAVKNSQIVIRTADIRDWPAFKLRDVWSFDFSRIKTLNNASFKRGKNEEIFNYYKNQIDTCFRWKLNGIHAKFGKFPNIKDPLFKSKMNLIHRIANYAFERGIVFRLLASTNINDYLSQKELEEDSIKIKRFGRIEAYCFSAEKAHRAKAKFYYQYLKWFPQVILCLHPVDAGAYHNPALWSRRGTSDRKKYGDDRVSATVDECTPYYEMLKELNPKNDLIIVPLPYHFQFALSDYPQRFRDLAKAGPGGRLPKGVKNKKQAIAIQKQLNQFSKQLAKKLDKEIFITTREAARDTTLACGNLYKNHPLDIWIYLARGRGWRGSFIPQTRLLKTFLRHDFKDNLYSDGFQSFGSPLVLAAAYAEYLWNSNTPDSSDQFTLFSRQYEVDGRELSSYQRNQLIPRICRDIFGDAASTMIPIYTSNISLNYVVKLKKMAWSWDTEVFDDPYKYLQEQNQKLNQASINLKQLLDKLQQGKINGPNGHDLRKSTTFGAVLYYIKYIPLLHIKSELDLAIADAEKALSRQAPNKAEKILKTALNKLPELENRYKSWLKKMESFENIIAKTPLIRAQYREEKKLNELSPSSYRLIYQTLLDRSKRSAQSGGEIPEHILEFLSERSTVIPKLPKNIVFDANGAPDNREWRSVPVLDFFTVQDKGLAQFETIVKMAWDEQFLYLSAQLLNSPSESQSKDFWRQDTIELILKSSTDDKKETLHFAMNMKDRKKAWIVKSDGSKKSISDKTWNTGTMIRAGEWFAEAMIPMKILKKSLGATKKWKFNIHRHRPISSDKNLAEDSFFIKANSKEKELTGWGNLKFDNNTEVSQNDDVTISIKDFSRKNQAISYASVTLLRFIPVIKSNRSLVNAKLIINVSKKGKCIIKETIDIGRIPGLWSPSSPLTLDLEAIYAGDLELTLTIIRRINFDLRRTSKQFTVKDGGALE